MTSFDGDNFPAFGVTIFKNQYFSINMDIMYIKWKLKSFWIQICYQKMQFYMIFFAKIKFQKFSLQFWRRKKFSNGNFSKILFYNPPNFYFIMVLNTKNGNYMKIWLQYLHPRRNDKCSKLVRADSAPPPALLRVKEYPYINHKIFFNLSCRLTIFWLFITFLWY